MKKISLVILTLNEIIGLKKIFHQIPLQSVDEVIVIDGGSTDGTLDFFQEHKIPVTIQTVKGRGEAFRLAFQKASGEAVIFFSPDGNEDPLDIPKFRPYLEKGYGMVIATRMVKGAENEEDHLIFKWRKWANNIFNLMANLLANLTWFKFKHPYVTDSINGFRALTKKTWDEIHPDGPGYTIEYQSTIRCLKKNIPIAEFPTIEGQRIDGREGSPSVSTGIAFIKMFFRELIWYSGH